MGTTKIMATDHKKKVCQHSKIYEVKKNFDSRGFLQPIREIGTNKIVFKAQDIYISLSKKFALRGVHVQISFPPAKKIITVIQGEIIAVTICCNRQCKLFGQARKFNLSSKKSEALLVPKLQAFGYLSLKNKTLIITCMDQPYDKAKDFAINPVEFFTNDIQINRAIISERDQKSPNLDTFLSKLHDKTLWKTRKS